MFVILLVIPLFCILSIAFSFVDYRAVSVMRKVALYQ